VAQQYSDIKEIRETKAKMLEVLRCKRWRSTELAQAAEDGNDRRVKALLTQFADPDSAFLEKPALWLAAGNGHARVCRLLLAAQADLNAR
jgi:hypothetical protein